MSDDKQRMAQLEAVIKQMLRPIKGIPLDLVISGFSGAAIIPFNPALPDDIALKDNMRSAAHLLLKNLLQKPIKRRRPNEVGNAIEPYVRKALQDSGFRVETPAGKSGRQQSAGYPDLLIFDGNGRPTYIECKTFSVDNMDSSLRAFYLSPSDDFKACLDARHLMVAIEMKRVGDEGDLGIYVGERVKVACLSSLLCDVKYEFNASNRSLYTKTTLIFEERIAE